MKMIGDVNMRIKRKINPLFPLFLIFIFSIGVIGFLSSANFFVGNLNKVNNLSDSLSKSMDVVKSLPSIDDVRRINETYINKEENNSNYNSDTVNNMFDNYYRKTIVEHDICEGMDDYAKNNTIFTNWNNSLDLEHSKNAFYATGILPKEELKLYKRCNVNLDPRLDCYCYNLVNSTYNDTVFNIAADGRFTFMTNCTNMSNVSFKIEINNIYFFINKYFHSKHIPTIK